MRKVYHWGSNAAGYSQDTMRADPREILVQVQSAIERILGHAIERNEPMTEAGLDSLGAVELHRSLEADFQLPLPATLAFDYPTPLSLAQHIASLGIAQAVYRESL